MILFSSQNGRSNFACHKCTLQLFVVASQHAVEQGKKERRMRENDNFSGVHREKGVNQSRASLKKTLWK
jgi:hypothetical protein